MSKRKDILFLIFILTIGLLLRIYGLSKYDFWYDEAISVITAETIVYQNFFDYGKYFTDPPLFYFLLKFWMLLGKSEFLLRLLPLIFGFLSIISIYFVGKVLFNKKVGLIGMFLLAISPFHIYYSQELRSYALVTLLTLMSIYLFVRILKENKLLLWIWFIVFTVFCLYSHNIGLFLLPAENIYFFSFYEKHKKICSRWLISQLTILLFYVPWLVMLIYQIIKIQIPLAFFWVPKPSPQVIIHTFNIFNLGYNATRAAYLYAFLIFLSLFLWGVWKGKEEKTKIYLLLYWLFVPIIITIFISTILKQGSLYLYRTLIYISPAYYIIVANGLNSIKKQSISFTLLSIIIILSIHPLQNQYNNIFFLSVIPYRPAVFEKKEFKSAADYIKRDFQEGDIIAHTCRSTLPPFIHYHNNKLEEKWAVTSNNIDWLHWKKIFSHDLSLSTLSLFKSFLCMDIKELSKDYRRIWLVFSGWEINERESSEIKKWLDDNLKILKEKDFKGINIYLYKTNDKNINPN